MKGSLMTMVGRIRHSWHCSPCDEMLKILANISTSLCAEFSLENCGYFREMKNRLFCRNLVYHLCWINYTAFQCTVSCLVTCGLHKICLVVPAFYKLTVAFSVLKTYIGNGFVGKVDVLLLHSERSLSTLITLYWLSYHALAAHCRLRPHHNRGTLNTTLLMYSALLFDNLSIRCWILIVNFAVELITNKANILVV